MTTPRSLARRGFTLIELVIVVALIAIVIGLVAPSFKRLIESQRVQNINAQLVTDLQLARSEAVARNAFVRVGFKFSASMTCYSIHTYPTPAYKCDCLVEPACTVADREIRTVRIPMDTNVQVRPPVGRPLEFAFEPIAGAIQMIPTDFGTPPLLDYDVYTRLDSPRALKTVVGLSGRPQVCAPPGSTMKFPPC